MSIQISPKVAKALMPLAEMKTWQQRLTIGAIAVFSHPLIDYYSPFIKDEETKKYAAIRSAIKVTIQATTGVLGRLLGQKLGEVLVNSGKIAVPAGLDKNMFPKAVGNILSIYCAFASIPLIEMPFINKLLTFVMDKYVKPKNANNEKKVNVNA